MYKNDIPVPEVLDPLIQMYLLPADTALLVQIRSEPADLEVLAPLSISLLSGEDGLVLFWVVALRPILPVPENAIL